MKQWDSMDVLAVITMVGLMTMAIINTIKADATIAMPAAKEKPAPKIYRCKPNPNPLVPSGCIDPDTLREAIAEREKENAERAAAAKAKHEAEEKAARERAAAAQRRLLAGFPGIGTVGPCPSNSWIGALGPSYGDRKVITKLAKICHIIYMQASPAARALGAPGFRLRSCMTGHWYKVNKGNLNLWSVLYFNATNWPWERDAWQSCKDGNFGRLGLW